MLKTWGIIWEASDRPDGQELGGGAVGGQGGLQEVKLLIPSGQSKASENSPK